MRISDWSSDVCSSDLLSNIGTTVDGDYSDSQSDNEWSGTLVLSYKPVDALLTYASYSKGYKAGGYNLDRSGLNPDSISVADLRFAPEKVDAYELGRSEEHTSELSH